MPHSGKVMMIGQSAGKDYAYLLGVFLGDGCVTRPSSRSAPDRRCFKLNTIDEDFALATKQALESLTSAPVSICRHPVSKSSKDNFSLYCGCDDLCHAMVADTASKQQIPDYVWSWEKPQKLAFIGGLMDSEGFVAEHKKNPTNRRFHMGFKSTDVWARDFARLLEQTGIRVGKFTVEKPRKAGYRTPVRFVIKMQSWVDSGAKFVILRKQRRVDEWASRGAYEMRALRPRRSASETNMPRAA